MKTLATALAVLVSLVLPLFLIATPEDDYSFLVTDGKATITHYTGPGGDVLIPSSLGGYPVTAIAGGEWSGAFQGHQDLTSVVIPDSVTTIGGSAFRDCTSLTSVVIPDSVTFIGGAAFSGCTSLSGIVIPNSVTSIEIVAFAGCTSLTSVTIPDSVTSIGSSAFRNCTSLTSVVIPGSVTSIGNSAFWGCTSLTNVEIPSSVTSIGNGAFENCTSLTSVVIADGVTSIGAAAFGGCTSLTSVTIPGSVTFIGTWAFGDCPSLTSMDVDSSNSHFSSASGVLFDVNQTILLRYPQGRTDAFYTIPDSVIFIEGSAFNGCTNLTSVVIPDSVTSIGIAAFWGCTSLTTVTIPNSVTSIGDSVFRDCTSLTSVVIPDGVTSIGIAAFLGCTSLISVTIPDRVTSIGNLAFWGCTSLTTVTIPNSVTSIGGSVFRDCTSLTSVTIPDSVTSIGVAVFFGCTSLTNIDVDPGSSHFSSVSGVLFNGNQTVLLQYPPGKTDSLYTITDSVTSIERGAFRDSTNLTSVVIPNSVTSIQAAAFAGCTSLTSVEIPASVASIQTAAFAGCTSLTSIDVDPANSHYSSASGVLFDGNQTVLLRYPQGKTDAFYTIPDSVTSIEKWAFEDSTNLTTLEIPNSVTTIGSHAFDGCTNLTSIDVDPANSRFSSVAGVLFDVSQTILLRYPQGKTDSSYTIPDSVTVIGDGDHRHTEGDHGAFQDSTNLTSVVIPGSVLLIGRFAFSGSSNLERAVFQGNAPSMASRVFDNTASAFSIFYFDGAASFTSPTWKGYPALNLGQARPFTDWLVNAQVLSAAYTGPAIDLSGDGVGLLMAYALNLDPRENLRAHMPQAVFAADQLSMSFFGDQSGLNYAVEVSTNLIDWDAAEVTLSTPDADGMRTAAVAAKDQDALFLRLVVEEIAP